jgi:hypothetical protein
MGCATDNHQWCSTLVAFAKPVLSSDRRVRPVRRQSRLGLQVCLRVFLTQSYDIPHCLYNFIIRYWLGRLSGVEAEAAFAASCSLVISAACHPAEDEKNPHLGEVKWGVVAEQVEQGYEHCSITSKHTKKRGLVEGRMYR